MKRGFHWFDFQVHKIYERWENFADDEEDVQTPLCLIGDAYENKMPMLMAPDGRVYISFQGLHDLGVSGEDAIEALCVNRAVKGFAEDHI